MEKIILKKVTKSSEMYNILKNSISALNKSVSSVSTGKFYLSINIFKKIIGLKKNNFGIIPKASNGLKLCLEKNYLEFPFLKLKPINLYIGTKLAKYFHTWAFIAKTKNLIIAFSIIKGIEVILENISFAKIFGSKGYLIAKAELGNIKQRIVIRNRPKSKIQRLLEKLRNFWYKLNFKELLKILLMLLILGFIFLLILTYILKYFGFLDFDLLDIFYDFLYMFHNYLYDLLYMLQSYLYDLYFGAIYALREIFGINELQNILTASMKDTSHSLQAVLKRLKSLEKKAKTYDENLFGPKAGTTILKMLIDDINERYDKLSNEVKRILNFELTKKFAIQKGLALEKAVKALEEEIQRMREDFERVISLEHKNLSERFKAYIDNLKNQLKSQIDEQIAKKLLELQNSKLSNKVVDNVIDTTLADDTTD